jgi:NAD(P)-dependent dehydrogenase (short-subunit alcohol dehydrogenase family)
MLRVERTGCGRRLEWERWRSREPVGDYMHRDVDPFALQKNLRVLITAGASGIGRAISDLLVARGARVHICDISDELIAQVRADHPQCHATKADVASEADVDRLLKETASSLGGLDALINNAGIPGPTGAVEDIAAADWRRTIDVNLTGQFLCARGAVPLLKAAGGGAIVNISSVAGRLGYAFRTPYASTKWAIIGFTQSLAKELGPQNIRVNAILPGVVEGPRMTGVIAARAAQTNVSFEQMEQSYLERISLRRMVTPEDVAVSVAYLLSPAGRNVSGQSLSVDANVEAI